MVSFGLGGIVISRRLAAAAVATVLASGGAVVVASPAEASECWVDRTQVQASNGAFTTEGTLMYEGPAVDCGEVTTGNIGDDLIYKCYIVDDNGQGWTYLRNNTQAVLGWTPDDYLLNSGSHTLCN